MWFLLLMFLNPLWRWKKSDMRSYKQASAAVDCAKETVAKYFEVCILKLILSQAMLEIVKPCD